MFFFNSVCVFFTRPCHFGLCTFGQSYHAVWFVMAMCRCILVYIVLSVGFVPHVVFTRNFVKLRETIAFRAFLVLCYQHYTRNNIFEVKLPSPSCILDPAQNHLTLLPLLTVYFFLYYFQVL